MPSRPSQPVLDLIRRVARQKGMNTAALARKAELSRGHLKHVLAGSEPMTVDEFIVLTQALELDVAAMAGVQELLPEEPEATQEESEGVELRSVDPKSSAGGLNVDPYGNHAEQSLQLGFGLGTDMFLSLQTSGLSESGVPQHVLKRYPEELAIRLDAAYHRHYDPRFLPEGLQITLSFDQLYTCMLPWSAFLRVTIFPLPPETPPEEPPDSEPEPDEDPGTRRGHLRLV